MSEKKWSLYAYPSAEEQQIFRQLIGEAFKTEALLVSILETKNYTEYIFIYNHPSEEMNNLVSFYGKVKKKKSKELELLEFATAQLTEKMILRNVNDVENLEDLTVKAKVASSIKFNISELAQEEVIVTTAASAVDYKTTSQATYYFDCDGDNGEIKGSFCCVLKDKSSTPNYYILTAGHNLQDGTVKKSSNKEGSLYKLIKDENNFVDLELMEFKDPGTGSNGADYAILKVNTPNFQNHDCFLKRIQFSDYSKSIIINEESIFPEDDKNGYIIGHNYKSGESKNREYNDYRKLYEVQTINKNTGDDITITPPPTGGTSGGAVFGLTNNTILGVYKGIVDDDKYCSVCEDIESIKNGTYKVI